MNPTLIVGLGISGIAVAHELEKNGIPFRVIDPCPEFSSTSIAAGVINPVTGRRFALQWNIQSLLERSFEFYGEMENKFRQKFIYPYEIIRLHRSADAAGLWNDKQKKKDLGNFTSELPVIPNILNNNSGGVLIKSALRIDTGLLLRTSRDYLLEKGLLDKNIFDHGRMEITKDGILYNEEKYGRIIFCEGISALHNPWFNFGQFKPSKGECLIVKIPGLQPDRVYNKGIILVPLKNDIFWAGATNAWDDLSPLPTEKGKAEISAELDKLLNVNWKLICHKAAVRPTIIDRSPIAGTHPHIPFLFILNGMGTKGTSLAPYYAKILIEHIFEKKQIPAPADIKRFVVH